MHLFEPAATHYAHHRHRPVIHAHAPPQYDPLDHGVAHDAHRMRVRDDHGTPQKPRLLHPGRPGHLTIAVHREPAGEHGLVGAPAAGEDRRDAVVRTGPFPTTSLPLPATGVRWPTSTPPTSVMALSGPVAPSKGMPNSRPRSGRCASDAAAVSIRRASGRCLRVMAR